KIVSQSPLMHEVFRFVRQVAPVDSIVLVTGESGTGKELIAEAIHAASARSAGPLVTINMAAVPEALVESELFGHVKGSFTGAGTDRVGRFEAANGGDRGNTGALRRQPHAGRPQARHLGTDVAAEVGPQECRSCLVFAEKFGYS
ncbi:MAG: sigma 54-interacting transcriptional regulator, partial [Pirellulaceae bacterium]